MQNHKSVSIKDKVNIDVQVEIANYINFTISKFIKVQYIIIRYIKMILRQNLIFIRF